jgi:hypothetical protein
MIEFVRLCFDLTSDYLPDAAAIRRRAESWLKLLTPAFFQPEVHYVLQVCCRLRADRRDAIKADELLRIAEKVYGCSVNFWANPTAERDPQVWSISAQEWIPLDTALEQLWREVYPEQSDKLIEYLKEEFKSVRPQLVEMIYGSN